MLKYSLDRVFLRKCNIIETDTIIFSIDGSYQYTCESSVHLLHLPRSTLPTSLFARILMSYSGASGSSRTIRPFAMCNLSRCRHRFAPIEIRLRITGTLVADLPQQPGRLRSLSQIEILESVWHIPDLPQKLLADTGGDVFLAKGCVDKKGFALSGARFAPNCVYVWVLPTTVTLL